VGQTRRRRRVSIAAPALNEPLARRAPAAGVAFLVRIPISPDGESDELPEGEIEMTWKITVLVATLALALPLAAAADGVNPPPVPANLAVPAGARPYLIGHASGTQAYVCMPTAAGAAWSFYGPQATLFDASGGQVMTHFLSPNPDENGALRATWQHSRDTSTVWGVAIASSTDPNYVAPGAVPWLLLRVEGSRMGPSNGDRILRTIFIQRVNTDGGVAPSVGCSVGSDVGKRAFVPYTTDYVFYR
jgi:hypothetical protein